MKLNDVREVPLPEVRKCSFKIFDPGFCIAGDSKGQVSC